jgi:hypothetical protein
MSSSSRSASSKAAVTSCCHAGSGFFEFLRELDVAVVLHARSGWDEATDDEVFLEAAQAVDRTVDAGFVSTRTRWGLCRPFGLTS